MNYIGDRLGFDIEFVDMTFVKKGGKDNVFSRLYEILKGFGVSADNRNRTCTELPQPAPEAGASASSAISAYI